MKVLERIQCRYLGFARHCTNSSSIDTLKDSASFATAAGSDVFVSVVVIAAVDAVVVVVVVVVVSPIFLLALFV